MAYYTTISPHNVQQNACQKKKEKRVEFHCINLETLPVYTGLFA
jgi:hypothetical protein